jgi:parvulin-like peptidyl-prolyl isomerase
MAKKKKAPTNRKRLARIERERLQKRYITIGAIVVIVTAIALAAFGIVKEGIIDPQKPVVTVNDRVLTQNQFQAWTRYQRFQLVNQYASYYNFMQSFGDSNNMFEQNLRQIMFRLEPAFMGASILERLSELLLVKEEAERRGITVSEEEVDTYIAENILQYYPSGTPTPTPTWETLPTSTLSAQQLTLIPPTATPEEDPADEATPTSGAEEPTVSAPTATPYTEEAYKTRLNEYIQYVGGIAKISEEEFRWIIESQIYLEKVKQAVTADIESEEEQVWARHILVESEEEAQDVIDQLEEGADFAELAEEVSIDTGSAAQGGDLGWFGRDQMVAPFEEAAFSLEIGEISEPVESDFGWHVIQVLGREVRQLPPEMLQQRREQAFRVWLGEQRQAADVEIANNWSDVVPEEPSIPEHMMLATFTPQPTAAVTLTPTE